MYDTLNVQEFLLINYKLGIWIVEDLRLNLECSLTSNPFTGNCRFHNLTYGYENVIDDWDSKGDWYFWLTSSGTKIDKIFVSLIVIHYCSQFELWKLINIIPKSEP